MGQIPVAFTCGFARLFAIVNAFILFILFLLLTKVQP
jgi:hypothetical protein